MNWNKEEVDILIDNQGKTINEIKHLFKNRSIKSIDYKIRKMHLNYLVGKQSIEGNIVKCSKCNMKKEFIETNFYINRKLLICKDCLKKQIYVNKVKRKSGIVLDFEKMLETYDYKEWINFILEGKIKKYPDFYVTRDKLIKMIRYVIVNKLNRTKRDEIIKTTRTEMKKFSLFNRVSDHFNTWYESLSCAFPELQIKPYELTETPKYYLTNKENANDYMRWLVNKIINNKSVTDYKKELPQYLSHKYLRDIKENKALDCIHLYKHYNSMYEWISKLFPDCNFKPEDFSTFISNNGKFELDSLEEKYVYDYIIDNFPNINMIAIGKKRKNNTYFNSEYNESYCPDFKIVNEKGETKVILEYFGLYNTNIDNQIFKEYVKKADRKVKYFNNINDIYFIDLYPQDLNNNFKGINKKLTSFLLQLGKNKTSGNN